MQTRRQLLITLTFAILVVCLVKNCYGAKNETVKSRIVGGVPVSGSRLPYLVNIRVRGNYICGGTLITRQFVLTAAHCVTNVVRRRIRVVGGSPLLSRGGVRRRVTKVLAPRRYNNLTLHRDIAVLKLNSPMTGNNIAPIRLCNRAWKKGSRVQVSGWGLIRENSTITPNRARTTSVRIMSKGTCQRRYRGYVKLTNSMFCASVPGSRDTCSGDAGGPLIYRGRICGVISWGIGCARNRFPGVYTSVRVMREFIRQALTK